MCIRDRDSSERRFIQINMEREPKKISFEKIYDYWKEFAQHCEPEENWQDWYDSFEEVVGIEKKDISDFKDNLISNGAILQSVKNTTDYTITLKFFSDIKMCIRDRNREGDVLSEQRKAKQKP